MLWRLDVRGGVTCFGSRCLVRFVCSRRPVRRVAEGGCPERNRARRKRYVTWRMPSRGLRLSGALLATSPACRRAADPQPCSGSSCCHGSSSPIRARRWWRATTVPFPGIDSSLETIPGSEYVVNALQDGDAELGFAQADVVYTAYRSGTSRNRAPYDGLRAIAVAQRASVFPVVKDGERASRPIADLRNTARRARSDRQLRRGLRADGAQSLRARRGRRVAVASAARRPGGWRSRRHA